MYTTSSKFKDYESFWPFYLSQHSKRATRLWHVLGTLGGTLALVKAVLDSSLVWLLLVPVIGYGCAWIAHATVEENRPATFSYPLWSLRGDFHMLWLWLTGQLETELMRRGITT
jgi:hypothetical protein